MAKRVRKAGIRKKAAPKPTAEPWDGMPEFVQPSMSAIARVVVNFETEADIEAFNKATGLKVTVNTKGVFFPHRPSRKLRYVDES